uniref:Uncharacterized protein n=1 Tax=Clytia hemisphaerica TaxID=252671 RepID=A0A7M5XBZ4_9CNID
TIDNLIVFTEDLSYRKLQVPPQGLDYQINGITLLPNGQEHAPIISDTERLMDDNKEYVFTQYVFYGVNGQITSLNFLAQPYAILEFKDIKLEFQTSSYLLTEMKIQNDLYGQITNGEAYLANTLVGLIDPDTETCIQDVSENCLPKLVEEVKLFSYTLRKIPIFDYLKRKQRLNKMRFLLIFPKDNNAAVIATDGMHWMRLEVVGKLKTNTEHLAFFPTPLQIEKKSPLIFTTRPIDLRNGNELLISSMHGCCGTLIISVKGITRPVFIKELKKSDENTQYTFNCQLNYAGAHQLVLVYLPTSLESYLIVDKIITKGTTYGPSLTSLTWLTEMDKLSYPIPDIMKIALSIYADPSKDFGIYWYSVSNTGTIKIPDRYGFQNRGEKFSQSSSPPHIPKIKTVSDKIEYTMFTVIVDVKISHGEVGEEYLFQFGREESNINTHFTVTIQSGFIFF